MTIYARLEKTAYKLIKKYGTLNTFTRKIAGGYDPQCGKARLVSSSTYTAYIVKDQNMIKSIGTEELSKRGDMRLIATAADYEKNDTLLINGVQYSIIDYEPINPGPKVVAVWLFVER